LRHLLRPGIKELQSVMAENDEVSAAEFPHLPLPDVAKTMERYLDAIAAVVPAEDHTRARLQAEALLADETLITEVEELLRRRRDETENWAYRFWLEDMYLNNTVALPINSNPGWVFPRASFRSDSDVCAYLARLMKGMLDFKQRVESGTVEQEVASSRSGEKTPLCMEQYLRVFNAYRQPGAGQDVQVVNDPLTARDSEHVIVTGNKGQMFIMPVKSAGEWHSTETLAAGLRSIQFGLSTLPVVPVSERVCALTASARDKWHRDRESLMQNTINAEVIRQIESCLFIVCLDDSPQNSSDASRSEKDCFRQMLSGHGPFVNGANRWFDKTIQIVCSQDGVNGICYEHSVSEGIAVVQVLTEVLENIRARYEHINVPQEPSADDIAALGILHIEWTLDDQLRMRILEAVIDFERLDTSADVEVFDFQDYGKDFMKGVKCSPDAFCQMILQLAYFKMHRRLGFSYESASTRRFRHGRVDNIRSSHPEALGWVTQMANPAIDNEARLAAFKMAIGKQTQVMVENITGFGMDVPMLGIREATRALRAEPIALFEDGVYTSSNLFQISTSQVPIALPKSYMGYGAVVPDGYGVSYNLQPSNILFCVASFFTEHTTDSREFCKAIRQSLAETKELFA